MCYILLSCSQLLINIVAQLKFMLTFPAFAISGDYGQLGHQSLISSDEPQCVEFFRQQQLHVVDVVCGQWNTFAAVVKKEIPRKKNTKESP